MKLRRVLKVFATVLGALVALFVLIQAVPYGRTHSNPPTVEEPLWASPRVRELAERACFDCHSNNTKWPWYASVAPFSWVVQFDVDTARDVINFSEWNRPFARAEYMGARTRDSNMPPAKYIVAHPEADLSPEEREELARGLDATYIRTNIVRASQGR